MAQKGPFLPLTDEQAVSPMIGTMFVFVIIVLGMSGGLVFGVPAIKNLQDRAAIDDVATQLEQVREEAERLTVEGAGAAVALVPSSGTVSLENGTRMAVAISYDGAAQQQGLSLAWGKGGKKKNQLANSQLPCDFHVQDWADSNNAVTLLATNCRTPMLWDPADAPTTTSTSSTGTTGPSTQTLTVSSVVASTGWTGATQAALSTSDDVRATYATNSPGSSNDLQVAMTDPTTTVGTITSVLIKGEVSVIRDGGGGSNDGFRFLACTSTTACGDDSSTSGNEITDTTLSYEAVAEHPSGNNGVWSWADITALQPKVRLDQVGGGNNGRDGTWRVDRVWVEVSSTTATSSTSSNGNGNSDAGECFEADEDVACLMAFKMTDASPGNRITSITSHGNDRYTLQLDAPVTGDWYFQLSKDPRVSSSDQLLAKAYIYDMDQLRWERDEGLTTWLEGGAVFGTQHDTSFLLSDPLIDEDIQDTGDPEPTYYARIIRFDGDQGSISGTSRADVRLRHTGTQSTTNDGVSLLRFDFSGESARLWCDALLRREVPEDYAYAEYEWDSDAGTDPRCDGHPSTGVQSVKYGHDTTCASNLSATACLQYLRANKKFFQVTFTEVHFDVTLRP